VICITHTLYHIKAAFNAFSFAHVPHAMVVTSDRPFGATFRTDSFKFDGNVVGGRIPRAERFAMEVY